MSSAKKCSLSKAKRVKNDEFYTQYADIQKEVNAYLEYNSDVFKDKTVLLPCDDPEWSNFTKFFAQNFENFGLKKLISTSYAINSKIKQYGQLDLPDNAENIKHALNFNATIDHQKGKIFTLTRKNKHVDYNDLEWEYLNGDGDFRSDEIKKLRNEADFVITNPPFSLFREFVSWLFESNKRFLIIGNMNAITYKEIFPLIKENKMWMGTSMNGTGQHWFAIPDHYDNGKIITINGKRFATIGSACWFTNIDHGRRHQPLELMTMADNIKFNKRLKGKNYQKYDNYDAIEVPVTNAIPSDYNGVMGVPISFLSKYSPEQFEIVKFRKGDDDKDLCVNGVCPYFRILIKKREVQS